MLDVRRDVLVVRVCAGQRGLARMGLRIVPVQLLAAAPDLVAVTFDGQRPCIPGQAFVHDQVVFTRQGDLAGQLGQQAAAPGNDQRRAKDVRKLLAQRVDKIS